MSLLIDIRTPDWLEDHALRDLLAPHLPGVTIHCGPPQRRMADVTMLATVQMAAGVAAQLPNLKLVQKLGAGVETMLSDPHLPEHVRVARLEPDVQADEIAEYCLTEVLASLRHLRGYQIAQQSGQWHPKSPKRAAETTVAVLGLGHIGKRTAELFAKNGFRTLGWSRSQKTFSDVICFAGMDGLDDTLNTADFVVAILPSTEETKAMLNEKTFRLMKSGSRLINVGRGDLIDDADLLIALDKGHLSGATLDVFHTEPLPANHPYWGHAAISVTPHVSGWNLGGGVLDVAENYKRLIAKKSLMREIDRTKGY